MAAAEDDTVLVAIAKARELGLCDAIFVGNEEKIDNYVASKLEAYDDAANDAERLEVIITEKHKALFGIGWEAYNDYRRTGYPRFYNMQTQDGSLVTYPATAREAALVPNGEFPRRLLYPALELNSNPNAPEQTTKATPVFWDKN